MAGDHCCWRVPDGLRAWWALQGGVRDFGPGASDDERDLALCLGLGCFQEAVSGRRCVPWLPRYSSLWMPAAGRAMRC